MSESAAQFNIHEAKTQLSRIIERVERGEEIVISRAGEPVAKVVPLPGAVRRTGRRVAARACSRWPTTGTRPRSTRRSPATSSVIA